MLELIIVSHTLIPINTDTYLSILYKDTVQMCISTLVSDIEKSHMKMQTFGISCENYFCQNQIAQ